MNLVLAVDSYLLATLMLGRLLCDVFNIFIYSRYGFEPKDIYNLDETRITTTQDPGKVICSLGKKQVGAAASYERGELTTICCSFNAIGNSLPSFYVCSKVNVKSHVLNSRPAGAIGVATRTGYINGDLFAQSYLVFFCTAYAL